jgi:putrescine transport system ATP-binding protein
VDESDHVIIDTPEGQHYVGHGITGTKGMEVSVAVRPEKIRITKDKPDKPHNWVQGIVKEMAYLGSYTVYHIKLPTGKVIKATTANAERLPDWQPTWDDQVYASWDEYAMVVLTQ